MRQFTKEELSHYDGKDGAPAFIAYRGQVYDVSSSYHWRKGKHQVIHFAGADLTGSFAEAPHGEEVFARFHVVGMLVPDVEA